MLLGRSHIMFVIRVAHILVYCSVLTLMWVTLYFNFSVIKRQNVNSLLALCICLVVYFMCAAARKYVTETELVVLWCVHFVTRIAAIGVSGATASILDWHTSLRITQRLSSLHSWLSGVSTRLLDAWINMSVVLIVYLKYLQRNYTINV